MATSPVQGQTLIVQMMLDAKARQSTGARSSQTLRDQRWNEAAVRKPSREALVQVHDGWSQRAEVASTLKKTAVAKTTPTRDPRVIDNEKLVRPRPTPLPPPASTACPGGRMKPVSTPVTPPLHECPGPKAPVPSVPSTPELSQPAAPTVFECLGAKIPVPPAPVEPASSGQTVIDHAIVLDNASDQTIADLANDGEDFGVVVGNGQHSENIILNNITATNCTDYGMYLGDVANWSINDSTFHQAASANQHGMRIGYGQNISITNTTVDSSLAGKSSLWLVDVEGVTVTDSTFTGGAIRLGSPPGTGLGEPTARDISITHSTINKISGGDLEAILAWPGSHNVHLSDLDITLKTSQHWLAIDSRNTSNITWSNIRVNGQIIEGFEGVGTNEPIENLLMRGIGPVAQCV